MPKLRRPSGEGTVSGQGRLGDKAHVPLDVHGCPACPHPGIGPAVQGSPDVNVNRRPALRVDDRGVHAACCQTNTWTATKGSLTVFINGKGAHRMGDQTRHCGGMGQLVEGSPNVIVGDSGGASGGGASNGGARSGRARGVASGETANRAMSPGSSAFGADRSLRGRSDRPGSDAGAQLRPTRAGGSGPPSSELEWSAALDLEETDSLDKTFIELELVDVRGHPVGYASYRVTASDGAVFSGIVDSQGRARINGVARGSCQVTFPELHGDDWDAD
jgi:uncharacterized Zn-binding protein involved in type VI secretion